MVVTWRGVTRNFICCNEDELISVKEDKIHNSACWLKNSIAASWVDMYRCDIGKNLILNIVKGTHGDIFYFYRIRKYCQWELLQGIKKLEKNDRHLYCKWFQGHRMFKLKIVFLWW